MLHGAAQLDDVVPVRTGLGGLEADVRQQVDQLRVDRLLVLLHQGRQLLTDAGVAVPKLTAEVLLCHALRREKVFLYAHPEYELTEVEWLHFGRYLHERLSGKPTQYITKRQEFYGREFRVLPAVMIPRPETEHVVETALDVGRQARRMVDIGTGSGAIAVTLAIETAARVLAVDLSAEALAVAAENARRLGAAVEFIRADLCSALAPESVDLVASNPPYVPSDEILSLQREVRDFEPRMALTGGAEGIDFYRRLVAEGARILRPGGWLIMELGIRQMEPVQAMMDTGWRERRIIDDLAGLPRVLAARFQP